MVMDIAGAREEIEMMVRKDDCPEISDAEIETLVRKAKRQDVNHNPPDSYETWLASTAYSVGDTVVATPREGGFFTCTVAGTSGTTQPTWPTETDDTVTDNDVTWSRTGAAPWIPTWNLPYAIALGWGMKMGKVAAAVDIVAAGQTIKRSQMIQNFKEVKRIWDNRASILDNIILQGSLRDRLLYQNITNRNDELFLDGRVNWSWFDEYYEGHGYTGLSPGGQWIDP